MAILIEDMRFHHDLHNLDVDLPNILLSEEGNNIYKRDFQKYIFFLTMKDRILFIHLIRLMK